MNARLVCLEGDQGAAGQFFFTFCHFCWPPWSRPVTTGLPPGLPFVCVPIHLYTTSYNPCTPLYTLVVHHPVCIHPHTPPVHPYTPLYTPIHPCTSPCLYTPLYTPCTPLVHPCTLLCLYTPLDENGGMKIQSTRA